MLLQDKSTLANVYIYKGYGVLEVIIYVVVISLLRVAGT
jgi:hypothetical protein